MQLPVAFRLPGAFVPPMYTWPRFLKRLLLTFLVLAVIVAYLFLAGGVIAFLALLAGWAGG